MPAALPTWILDGFWGNHSRFENLRRRLHQAVGPARIWAYDNRGTVPIQELARTLARDLLQSPEPVSLVGYSMGGLVIRAALAAQPSLPVRSTVFLNTPHAGTWTALALPLPATRQMRPGSPFLRELDAAPWNLPALAVWCPADAMVVPGHSARWPRASHFIRSDVPAHVWPIYSPSLHREVARFLAS
jgi:triacylglycerol lipase